jgi:hypothetical protein
MMLGMPTSIPGSTGAAAQSQRLGQHMQGCSCVAYRVLDNKLAYQHYFWKLWGWQTLAMFLAPLPIHSTAQQLVDVGLRAADSNRDL